VITVRWSALDEAAWERLLSDGGEAAGGRRAGATHVGTVVRAELPARLADRLLADAGVPADRPLAQLRREERRALAAALARHPLPWTGDVGYRKAEVTGGGVALEEVNPRTMESRRQPGLFLAGELLDAFGPIGGNNFLWAWATGRAAGLGAGAA
jgi:predicted flavoprotein YhiN